MLPERSACHEADYDDREGRLERLPYRRWCYGPGVVGLASGDGASSGNEANDDIEEGDNEDECNTETGGAEHVDVSSCECGESPENARDEQVQAEGDGECEFVGDTGGELGVEPVLGEGYASEGAGKNAVDYPDCVQG